MELASPSEPIVKSSLFEAEPDPTVAAAFTGLIAEIGQRKLIELIFAQHATNATRANEINHLIGSTLQKRTGRIVEVHCVPLDRTCAIAVMAAKTEAGLDRAAMLTCGYMLQDADSAPDGGRYKVAPKPAAAAPARTTRTPQNTRK